MLKYIRKIFLYLLGIALLLFLLRNTNLLPDWLNPFGRKPLLIDNTIMLVEEVKSIAQLVSIEARDEVVIDSVAFEQTSGGFNPLTLVNPALNIPKKKSIVMICKGKVLAGIDLKGLSEKDLVKKGDTLVITLPKASILSAIMNPSDFEVFDENGSWPAETVQALKVRARKQMVERAIQQKLLEKANERGIAVLRNFFMNAGAKHIEFKQ